MRRPSAGPRFADAAGRVRTVSYPGSVVDSRNYDAIGRLFSRSVTGVIADALEYDWQGRIRKATQSDRPVALTRYNGLGAVVEATDYQAETGMIETFDVDALGNRLYRTRNGARASQPGHPDFAGARRSEYDAHGRLVRMYDEVPAVGEDTYISEEIQEHDPAGNIAFTLRYEADKYNNTWAYVHDAARSYYGADGKLRIYRRHLGVDLVSDDTRPGQKGVFEEYRYDALGRRILVRSRKGPGCSVINMGYQCASFIERTVWDGDQILMEIRGNGADSVSATALEATNPTGDAYGIVSYTHALGIDQPLSVIKGGVAVMPHANWRGVYAVGTGESGQALWTGYDWPGANTTLDGVKLHQPVIDNWWGNLITGKVDGSGMKYMRNRYYDPATGQFTQEDPIGLWGGMNLYGYAGGDPVNASDPFGLCPNCGKGFRKRIANIFVDDPVLSNPARRARMDAAFEGAPFDADGYRVEAGEQCRGSSNCRPGTEASRDGIRFRFERRNAPDWDFHTHGNIGRACLPVTPQCQKYTSGPSLDDVLSTKAAHAAGFKHPSYIVEDDVIWRMLPGVTPGKLITDPFPRWIYLPKP